MVQIKQSIALLIVVIMAFSILFQVWQIWQFVNAGGRFTDHDGQALCERVLALEQYSYGYHDAGHKSHECNYIKK